MKVLFLAVLIFAFVHPGSCGFSANTNPVFIKALAKPCKEAEGASDQDLEELASRRVPETEAGKCLLACLAELMHFIENGVVNRFAVMRAASINMDNFDEMKETLEDIWDVCNGIVVDAERCEAAYLYAKCIQTEAIKHRIPYLL